ncbi:hypothetical protein LRS74_20800 [Streptomyces sp. LX-29]|uniref:hypothetical protein n=1 Tax=Streptomyces sp. LX-29 TaxID=2900152 RepID=UPI00240D7193|nr:hypothetical protein [Streptomyces sp. LX-29]WFB09204.1 hypothetical protein LRS74_20800 [Streptomyces sp. LX-29]
MRNLIAALLAWLRGVFGPGSGRRRAGACPAGAAPAARWLPAHRSPYGLREVFDGDTIALVRPYLIAHERRQERVRQRRRRRTLVLAANFSIDLGARVLRGVEVAR